MLFLIDIAAGGLACGGLKTKSQALGLAALCIIFAFMNSVSFQSLWVLNCMELKVRADLELENFFSEPAAGVDYYLGRILVVHHYNYHYICCPSDHST